MKLGKYQMQGIQQKILENLYDKSESDLEKRKKDLVKRSRDLYIGKIQDLIDKMPIEMVTHSREHSLHIKYQSPSHEKYAKLRDWHSIAGRNRFRQEVDEGDKIYDICEYWDHTFNVSIPNPQKNSGYGGTANIKIEPELEDEAAVLCEHILETQLHKMETELYLRQTMEENQGTKGLKEVWPASLHKFLPAEKIIKRAPRTKKEKKERVVHEVPSHISTQMTVNLLEGE